MSSRLRYVLDEMYNYRWIHIGIIIFNAMIIFVAALNLIDLKNYRAEVKPGDVEWYYNIQMSTHKYILTAEGDCEWILYHKNWQIDPENEPNITVSCAVITNIYINDELYYSTESSNFTKQFPELDSTQDYETRSERIVGEIDINFSPVLYLPEIIFILISLTFIVISVYRIATYNSNIKTKVKRI